MNDSSNEVDVTFTLPVGLVRDAEESGLLTSEVVEAMLREELRTDRVRRLFNAADRLAALPDAPLTPSEVEQEIQSARFQRRSSGTPAQLLAEIIP